MVCYCLPQPEPRSLDSASSTVPQGVPWRSPGDRTRNQIDYICVNERWRNSILDCKTYPGADIGSDHNPVVAKVRVILKKTKATELRRRRDYQSIDPATRHEIEHFGRQIWTHEDRETKETTWEKFKRDCHLVDEKFVPVRKQHKTGGSLKRS